MSYSQVGDVLERFETLVSAHNDLESEQKRLLAAVDQCRRDVTRVGKEASTLVRVMRLQD
jgi:hypothetical protein